MNPAPLDPVLDLAPRLRGLAARCGHRALVTYQGPGTAPLTFPAEGPWPELAGWGQPLPAAVALAGAGVYTLTSAGLIDRADRNAVLRGKVAVVTGGAQGFGEEITRGLVAAGARVVIADLNGAGARRLAEALNSAAGQELTRAVEVNVTVEASVQALIRAVAEAWGGLDLFVSNAGVLKASGVLEQDLASFEFVTSVNYTAYMLGVKHAGRVMAAQAQTDPAGWTDIVQINSKSGLEGSNKNGSYAGSKFGGIGLTQSFALELVAHRIKVNAICPGNFFDGPLWSDPQNGLFAQYLRTGKVPGATTLADVKAFYEAKVPMNRGCTGADVLKALTYIVEQDYETGQAVPVTGGQVMLN